MLHLITTYWQPRSRARKHELDLCIQHNLDNPHIDGMTILYERKPDDDALEFDSDKLTIVEINERPKFRTFFTYANENLGHNDQVMVANTDIYFDDSIGCVKDCDLHNTIYCITRHNHLSDGRVMLQGLDVGVRNYASHDVWIFKPPIREFGGWDVMTGVIGCDSHFAGLAKAANYRLKNPCETIVCHHLHHVGERNDTPGFNYWNDPNYSPLDVPWSEL